MSRATGIKLTRVGYIFGAWNAYDINNQYRNGEIDQTQRAAEQTMNGISTFGGVYGAAAGIGWELVRGVASIPWYRANIIPIIQDLIGVKRDNDYNKYFK